MIYCLTRKPEEYSVGGQGLWQSYGHDPHLFSLLSRTSSAFFMFEQGFEEIQGLKKIVNLQDISLWQQTLDCVVRGVKIRDAVETMSPREFSDLLYSSRELLPLHALYDKMEDEELKQSALWFNSLLRTYQHEKYYRGKIGPGLTVSFRSRLTPEEDTWLEQQKEGLRLAMGRLINGK